jgi:hypothetical protein
MPGAEQITLPQAAAVQVLHDLGHSTRQIEREIGLSDTSAHDILHRHGRWGETCETPVFKRLRAEQKAHLEATSRTLAAKCLIQVDKTLDKTSAYQAAGIYGLLRTHERLDAGEATVNVDVHLRADLTGMDQLCTALARTLVSRETTEVSPDKTDK